MKRSWMKWVLMGSIGLAGCAGQDAGEQEPDSLDDGKYEAWNRANNPAYVDSTFVYDVAALPIEGQTAAPPIPADYWATASDSINVRWDGDASQSPAEKIEKGLNKPGFAKAVTDNFGILSGNRKACKESSECEDQMDGSSCVTPREATGDKPGRCIPGWWGICHGWSPYAIREPAATRPVVRNGVTFYPGDLEGIMSLVYSQNLPTTFLSSRCNKEGNKLGTDNMGRIRDSDGECRDMNPGTLHVIATNFLGLRKTGFVEDRTYDLQVWNQPVRGFHVTNAKDGKLVELAKGEAVAKLGLDLSFANLVTDVDVKKMEKKAGDYTATNAGEIVVKMTGTGDADLYVKKGAEPTDTVYDCRPYGGTSNEECHVVVAAGDKVFWSATGYGDTSKISVAVGSRSGEPNYVYNTAAKRFFYVEMDIHYISEARPGRESHVGTVDQYTRTDSYQYILEADDAGKILGGEWVGDSRTMHPDFAWWPAGTPTGSLPGGLSYAEAKSLNDEAAGLTNRSTGGGSTVTPIVETKTLASGVAVSGLSQFWTLGVPGGAKVKIDMTGEGSGNADLYVQIGRKPTITNFLAKSVGTTSTETVSFTAPAAGGTYYVRARPTSGSSKVTVIATITK